MLNTSSIHRSDGEVGTAVESCAGDSNPDQINSHFPADKYQNCQQLTPERLKVSQNTNIFHN